MESNTSHTVSARRNNAAGVAAAKENIRCRPSLSRLALTEAGLVVERLHYANALGLIGYFMATKVFRLMPKEGPMVKVYDTLVLPATKAAEQRIRPPFGQSVFAVARVPA